ncbi:hypothetical protein BJX64DRAFT_270752 [Aspergillus heterothallicus]
MEPFIGADKPKWSRVRMRKACDHCRRVKSKCEKTEGSPSCTACEIRGIACIITSRATSKSSAPRRPHACSLALDSDASAFISERQRCRVVLYDWIYGNTRSSDLFNDHRLLAHLSDDEFRNNVQYALSCLAKIDTIHYDTDFLATTGLPEEFTQLPDESELLRMILCFSESISVAFPIFREYIDTWLTERTYLDPHLREDLPAWASLNIVLAIGYKQQDLQYPHMSANKRKCEAYLKNALETVPRLIFKTPTLADVEALLGMVLLMYCSVEYPLSHGLLAVAMRKARTLGVEQGQPYRPGDVIQERRARVFWLGYVLDKMTSFVQGLAPCEDDNSFGVDMPRSGNDHSGTIRLPNGFRLPFGQHLCQLAVIKARIFKQLYSTHAHYDPALIEDLSSQLRAWRKSVHPECEASLDAMEESSFSRLSITTLLLCYHHTVISLYRAEYLAHANNPQAQITPLAACTRSARKALRLARYYPVYAPIGVRSVLNTIFASFVVLTMHILDEPSGSSARGDLVILQDSFKFVSNVVRFNSNSPEGQVSSLTSMLTICRWHLESAERAILSAEATV